MKTILVDAAYCFTVDTKAGFQVWEPLHELLEELPNKKILLTGADDAQRVKFGLNNVPYEVFSLSHNPEKITPSITKSC